MPDELKVNVPLLRKALEHITEHPEEWDQEVWARPTSCGTACCLAGTAVLLAGHEFAFTGPQEEALGLYWRTTEGEQIEEVAQRELGLSDAYSALLFLPSNTLQTLWRYANELTDGEIEIPEKVRYPGAF